MRGYLLNVLIALDQLLSAILGGDPDETISSRLGKNGPRWAERVVDGVFLLLTGERGHCKASIEADEGKDGVA